MYFKQKNVYTEIRIRQNYLLENRALIQSVLKKLALNSLELSCSVCYKSTMLTRIRIPPKKSLLFGFFKLTPISTAKNSPTISEFDRCLV